MKQFLVKILGASGALALAGWLVFSLFFPEYYLPVLLYMLLFFLVATILVHAWQVKMAKKDMAKFTRSNMLVTFFKLMVYSVFAVVYIAVDKENALIFVICLVLVYLVFTWIEVTELMHITRNSKNPKS